MQPLSKKLEIILNLINVSDFTIAEYHQLSNALLNYAAWIKIEKEFSK